MTVFRARFVMRLFGRMRFRSRLLVNFRLASFHRTLFTRLRGISRLLSRTRLFGSLRARRRVIARLFVLMRLFVLTRLRAHVRRNALLIALRPCGRGWSPRFGTRVSRLRLRAFVRPVWIGRLNWSRSGSRARGRLRVIPVVQIGWRAMSGPRLGNLMRLSFEAALRAAWSLRPRVFLRLGIRSVRLRNSAGLSGQGRRRRRVFDGSARTARDGLFRG